MAISIDEYKTLISNVGKTIQSPYSQPKKSKYGSVRCEFNGIKFASKLEMRVYQRLLEEKNKGIVTLIIRQPAFDLPGSVKYYADFFVIYWDGNLEFIDCKGQDTPLSILKRKQVKAIHGIDVVLIKSHDYPKYHSSLCKDEE